MSPFVVYGMHGGGLMVYLEGVKTFHLTLEDPTQQATLSCNPGAIGPAELVLMSGGTSRLVTLPARALQEIARIVNEVEKPEGNVTVKASFLPETVRDVKALHNLLETHTPADAIARAIRFTKRVLVAIMAHKASIDVSYPNGRTFKVEIKDDP